MKRGIKYLADSCLVAVALFWVFNIFFHAHPAVLSPLYAHPIIIDALLIISFCTRLYLGVVGEKFAGGGWRKDVLWRMSAGTTSLCGTALIALAFVWLFVILPWVRNNGGELLSFAIVPFLLLVVIGATLIGLGLYGGLFRAHDRH